MDNVLNDFLDTQRQEIYALAAESDLLNVHAIDPSPPRDYAIELRCKGLQKVNGDIVEHDQWNFRIRFSDDHLRIVDPFRLVTVLTPTFHSNVYGPFVCLGRIRPAISLVDIVYQLFEIFSFQNFSPHDGVNQRACAWCREHMDRFPIDRRPLKYRLPAEGVQG